MKKRFFAFLIFVMSLVLVTSCDINKKKEKLEVPTNVAVSEEGLVTWDEVKNADAYFVEINEENIVARIIKLEKWSKYLEKVEKIIKMVFENPKSLKYREQFVEIT